VFCVVEENNASLRFTKTASGFKSIVPVHSMVSLDFKSALVCLKT